MTEPLTPPGAVFWPVGTGDSTTIVVDEEIVVQIDLHDMAKADAPGSAEVAVVDRLVESLPKTGPGGMPYLAVFVLTHADLDHCCGFEDLLSEVAIGEIWATPRLWREMAEEGASISGAAQAFQAEAERRVEATKKAIADGKTPESGDRVLIIGYDTDHDDHAYGELPDEYPTGPGKSVTTLDGVDCTGRFEAFLHAPFKDDCAKDRNATSVAMQVTLADGDGSGHFLLVGDLAYETIRKIFDYSAAHGREARLDWDVLLAPHHCSKHVMYVGDELKQDVLDSFEAAARTGARIVSSSRPFPAENNPGDNPPHVKARNAYETIVDEPVLCTMEHGSAGAPSPVVFEVTADGLRLLDADVVAASRSEKAYAAAPGRLRQVAASAAEYAQRKAAADPAWSQGGGGRQPGAERIARAVVSDRGDRTAPPEAVGFGQR